jgi:hypothetical protein
MADSQTIGKLLRQAAEIFLARFRELEAAHAHQSPDESFAQMASALDELLGRCRATGVWGPENRLLSSELWNVAGAALSRGWLQNRARTKPRGYAGDYELLSRMFHSQLCDDSLGRLMDQYFQRDAAPVAVRGRMAMMADWIVEAVHARGKSPIHVAVVGSALGLDVREALLRLDEAERAAVSVTLLDLDPDAIEFGRSQLAPLLGPDRLTAVSCNLFRLTQRPPLAEPLRGVDLLFCPGIFDYLDDAAGEKMLRLFWQCLVPGGRMMVFQFAPHNPSRALMEWIGNWYLIYRDRSELELMTAAAGIPREAATFGSEPLGVDLLVTAERP